MRFTLVLAAVLVIGCGRVPGPVNSTVAADSAARAAMAHYVALLNGAPPNPDSAAAMYAPTGELLGAGQEAIRGPGEIRAFLASFGNVRVDSAEMTVTSSTVAGDRVTLWGTFAQRVFIGSGAPIRPHGRYVAEWVRDSTGRWLVQRMLTQGAR